MKSKRKLFSVICIVLCLFGVLLFVAQNVNTKVDDIDLVYNEMIADKYPEVVKQFSFYQRNGKIELYEYANNASYSDTLMFYYFVSDDLDDDRWLSVNTAIGDYLNVESNQLSVDNLDEIINTIYYYSLLADKYNLKVEINTEDVFCKVFDYLEKQEQNIVILNYYWKMERSASRFEMKERYIEWDILLENTIPQESDGSLISYQSIKSCAVEDQELKAKTIDDILLSYREQRIDIESLIIYLDIFPAKDILLIDKVYIEEVFNYCYQNYFTISPYISFRGFCISSMFDSNFASEIYNLIKCKPQNAEGFVATLAQIIPTYRRAYHYVQICNNLGININKADVYEWTSGINNDHLSPEELYYLSLLSREYVDFEVPEQALQSLLVTAKTAKITLSNYYSYYYLIKACVINNIECDDLFERLIEYSETLEEKQTNSIIKIWNIELSFLIRGLEIDYDELIGLLQGELGDLAIEASFYYALILKNTGTVCPESVKNEISSLLDRYYIENDQGGGFWNNSEFRYIDISKTYYCIFLQQFIIE